MKRTCFEDFVEFCYWKGPNVWNTTLDMIGNDWKSSWRGKLSVPCRIRKMSWLNMQSVPSMSMCQSGTADGAKLGALAQGQKGKATASHSPPFAEQGFGGAGPTSRTWFIGHIFGVPCILQLSIAEVLSWVCLRWFCNISALENPPEMGNLLGTWFIFLGPLLICPCFFWIVWGICRANPSFVLNNIANRT